MIEQEIFRAVLGSLRGWNPVQLERLEAEVKSIRDEQTRRFAVDSRTRARNADRTCPHCGFGRVYKHGFDAGGRQRYRCVADRGGCGRSFNALTGTPFSRMRKPELWGPFIRAMGSGHRSLEDLHRHGGIGVSRRTLWRWRRAVMEALGSQRRPEPLQGVVEADETYFRESFKGSRDWKRGRPPAPRPPRRRGKARKPGTSWEQVPVLTAVDRAGGRREQVVGYKDELAAVLLPWIEPGSVLCTDALAGFRQVAREARSPHFVIPSKATRRKSKEPRERWLAEAVQGSFGLARVNALHAHLKSFVNMQARGVSTRHLQGYLEWTQAVRTAALDDAEVALEPTPDVRPRE